MNGPLRVIVAGYGQMGHAFGSLLQGRAEVRTWAIAPGDLGVPAAIAESAGKSELLFICVPTVAHAAVLSPLVDLLPAHAGVLSIAKGLDDAGRPAAAILHQALGTRPWGVLGGPMIADEIQAGRPAFAALGTTDTQLFARCDGLFGPGRLRLVRSPSAMAVSWCGVFKNIYAPLLGICDELHWGDNTRGHLIMTALDEMQGLVRERMGDAADVYGDAGLADFVATVSSPHSHHYALGRRVARDESDLPECEGLHSLRVLQRGACVDTHAHPLYGVAAGLITAPASVPRALHGWLMRDG